jgi:hypothetical protein
MHSVAHNGQSVLALRQHPTGFFMTPFSALKHFVAIEQIKREMPLVPLLIFDVVCCQNAART